MDPIYYINPEQSGEPNPPPAEPQTCHTGCRCGYVQFESLIPYLEEIRDKMRENPVKATEFEFKLREQIIEVSRIFDISANVAPGFFSPAHFQTTRVYTTNGTRFLKVPEFVAGSLEVRTMDNYLVDPSLYALRDGFLVYLPCAHHPHAANSCRTTCGDVPSRTPQPWPDSCYQVTARWGTRCADMAVQMAVREYLIESYRVQDPAMIAATGIPASRSFTPPYSWIAVIENFRSRRALYSQFAIG